MITKFKGKGATKHRVLHLILSEGPKTVDEIKDRASQFRQANFTSQGLANFLFSHSYYEKVGIGTTLGHSKVYETVLWGLAE